LIILQPQERERKMIAMPEIIDVDVDFDIDIGSNRSTKEGVTMEITPQQSDPSMSVVNLCGAVSIQEVRILLREWILSTQGRYMYRK